MQATPFAGPCWSTAAMGPPRAAPLPGSDGLDEHLLCCRGAAGRGFALRCGVEVAHGFVAARFVSSLLVVLLLLAASAWLLT
jgi:hypothetical protein